MKCMINGDPFTFDKEQSIQDVLLALELDRNVSSLNIMTL